MSNTIYLYLKTHNKTGLKYLGKTIRDPYIYKGSGKKWKDHINKHGYDVTTEILYETKSIEEFRKVSLDYSKKWNIVENSDFANFIPENGEGGATFKGKKHTEETKKIISEHSKKLQHTEETKKKIGDASRGKRLIRVCCPHCGEHGTGNVMKRWHFDNCKLKG